MLNHYKYTKGYVQLYLMLLFGVSFLTWLFSKLVSAIGLTEANQIAGGVIFAAFWILGFVVMQRFLSIEKRRPTLMEANIIGVKSVVYVFGTLFIIGIFVSLIMILIKIFGNDGGASSGGSSNKEANPEQALKAIAGLFGTMLLFYAAPFLNFALVARMFAPKSQPA